MAKVCGIVFKEVGKVYWFNPEPYRLKIGDKVVVETVRGVELGDVVMESKEIDDSELKHELKPVIRIANKYDLKSYAYNNQKAEKDFIKCQEIVNKHKNEIIIL